ncbi:hypothetical protein [Streptomyces sp. NPDC056291]|uniref:hypothetical protein n=1 Tax=Streptomyces sp. NPDC056291 TaxID=3345772 RepID=UPI0035E15ABD
MPRRTLARNSLLTFAAQPWNLFEDDPTAGGGGGGGGGTSVNEHGYPDATPVADMTSEHQVAYWKHHARKHEAAAKSAPDAAELERLRAAEAELATRKAAEMSDAERVQAEKEAAQTAAATAKAEAEAATRKALLLEIALDKGLTPAQAARLQGSSKEELEADADELTKLFGSNGNGGGNSSRSGGSRGSDVGNTTTVTAGAERYRQKYGKQ